MSRPRRFTFPDLSALDDGLVPSYMVSLALVGGFPPGKTQHLVTGFVRCTESALRRYEEARTCLERSAAQDSLKEYMRGTDDLEVAFTALHRAMRLAQRLHESPATRVGRRDLPRRADRELLREVRNAIDHADGPVIAGLAGKGNSIRLEVQSEASLIYNGDRTLRVTHAQMATWIEQLHSLARALTGQPAAWAVARTAGSRRGRPRTPSRR